MTARVVLGLLLAVALVLPGTAIAQTAAQPSTSEPEMHVSQPGGFVLVRAGG
jgi:hypothetical protein